MVLIAESPQNLQKKLNTLHVYCIEWKLEVNVQKTKIVVFTEWRKTTQHRKFVIQWLSYIRYC